MFTIRLEVLDFNNVELWHPATSSTQEVKEWRQFLMDSEIQQPFKQAYREIYILTDAEIKTKFTAIEWLLIFLNNTNMLP
ncbi:MAG: DUF4132 domain-containing protein [Saprospiraceae bacterium]|nr:DUF4132 domain-containing protein [Saprospiraceae bacterium]